MSLQAKIKQELDDLAFRIIRKVQTLDNEQDQEKLQKMAVEWFNLKRLLTKAEELEKQ
jgi:hypothetical protein